MSDKLELNSILHILDRTNVNAFYQALDAALFRMSYEQLSEAYLYIYRRNAVAISFNKIWDPFIGYTAGYNEDDFDSRTRLIGGGEIIELIRSNLQELYAIIKDIKPSEARGGRIFIERNRVYRFTYEIEVNLCNWLWLGDNENEIDPVKNTLQLIKYHQKRKAKWV